MRSFAAEEWGTRLIRRWDESWMELPYVLGDRIGAAMLGAAPRQMFVGDSTTVLLYKLIRAAVDGRPDRTEIVIDDDNFPTDRFVVEGIAAERGLTIRWVQTDHTRGVTLASVASALSPRTAVVVLSHVAYRSGGIADMPGITAAAHFTPLVDAADLDGAALTANDPFVGASIDGGRIALPELPGLGVRRR